MAFNGKNDGGTFVDEAGVNRSAVYAIAQLSAADRAALASAAGVYRRAAAVSATPGDGLLISGTTTAGTITVGLGGGGSITINVPVGSTILPLGAVSAALGTAQGGSFQSLFFT